MIEWMLEGTSDSILNNNATPRLGGGGGVDAFERNPKSIALRTSSLLESMSILIDLIRKNNSDFVEQQTLAWARRKEFTQASQELTGEIDLEIPPLSEMDQGPCLLDLGEMLQAIALRLGGFQELIKNPRSLVRLSPRSVGLITETN
jgi:hypothetical protein